MTVVLGYVVLAVVVALFLWWEWRTSEADRLARIRRANELRGGLHAASRITTQNAAVPPPVGVAEGGPRARPRHVHCLPALVRRGAAAPAGRSENPAHLVPRRGVNGATAPTDVVAPARLTQDSESYGHGTSLIFPTRGNVV